MISLPVTVSCTSEVSDTITVRAAALDEVHVRVRLDAATARDAVERRDGAGIFLSRKSAVRLRKALKAALRDMDAA